MDEKQNFQQRLDALPWDDINQSLRTQGTASLPGLLTVEECLGLRALAEVDALFSKRTVMEEKNFGRGSFAYFTEPPPQVSLLRKSFYERTAPVAAAWLETVTAGGKNIFGVDSYPALYEDFAACCARNGQGKSACLMLEYGDEGYNTLHQDKYGEIFYPFQLVVQLSRPGEDFAGGVFLLKEGRSTRHLDPLQGDGLIFPSVCRVREGALQAVHHGVAPLTGSRRTLGVVAHGRD